MSITLAIQLGALAVQLIVLGWAIRYYVRLSRELREYQKETERLFPDDEDES